MSSNTTYELHGEGQNERNFNNLVAGFNSNKAHIRRLRREVEIVMRRHGFEWANM